MNARQRRKAWRYGCRLILAQTPVRVAAWWAPSGFEVCRVVTLRHRTNVACVVPFYKVATPGRLRYVSLRRVRPLKGQP